VAIRWLAIDRLTTNRIVTPLYTTLPFYDV